MKLHKRLAVLLAAVLIFSLLAGCQADTAEGDISAAEGNIGNVIGYPPKELNGIIQWGVGGGTDSIMRPLAVLAQDILNTNLVLTNKTGDTGAVARFVRVAYINAMSPVFGEDDPGKNANENIMRLFHTLNNVAMVRGMGAMADGSYEYTVYTGGYASGIKTYFWNTYEDPTLNSVTITEELATSDKIQTFSPKDKKAWGRQAFASDVSQ